MLTNEAFRGISKGAKTLSKMTFSKMTFSKMTFSKMTFSKMSFSKMTFSKMTFSINLQNAIKLFTAVICEFS